MTNTKKVHDSETPSGGQQVITACAFIHHDFNGVARLFLPRRALSKKFLPGVFELPGGHVDFGEDIKVGLIREIEEEFNMRIVVGDPFYVFTYLNKVKGSHSIEVIFFAKFISPLENIKLDENDHSEFHWVAQSEVKEIMRNNNQEDDAEFVAINKGFMLLAGNNPSFG